MHPSSPVLLLVLTGASLAGVLLLARVSSDAGAAPLVSAFVSTAGAGLLLRLAAPRADRSGSFSAKRLWFFLVAGLISYAVPNALVFATADRVGPGYASTLHAFVPVTTYTVALGLGLDRLSVRRSSGLLLGLVGALAVVISRLDVTAPTEAPALLLGLLASLSIAVGNVVRSRFWPSGLGPEAVGSGLLIAAAAQLAVLCLVTAVRPPPLDAALPLAAQAVAATLFYVCYFRLQHIAGPVYLSQLGYIAAAVGMPAGVLLYGEPVTPSMIVGMGLIVVGVVLVRPVRAAR